MLKRGNFQDIEGTLREKRTYDNYMNLSKKGHAPKPKSSDVESTFS